VEIGPRDIEKNTVAVARRDTPGKAGKAFVSQEGLLEHLTALLENIQSALFERALKFRADHTFDVTDMTELKTAVDQGFARAYWAGTTEDEDRLQAELKASVRAIPFDQPEKSGKCIVTGAETTQQVILARAY
jgi:prolyl-tRNA synthetase